jgi:hypothetical protein
MSTNGIFQPISATDFRVIHLLPGEFEDEIQCVLERRSSGIKTRYEALSYQWGDETVTKPIRIAHLDSPPRSAAESLRTAWVHTLKSIVASGLRRAFSVIQATIARYKLPFRILGWAIGTGLLWRFIAPLPFEAPAWAAWLIPRDIYIALLCMALGVAALDYLLKAFTLAREVAKTKPWQLASGSRLRRGDRLDFEPMQVTTNLELALRYLRHHKQPRTLWIDAVCIDQANEDEKRLQIQRMDFIYANASSVVVWLGGYHAIGGADNCNESSTRTDHLCVHRRQINAAFQLARSLGGLRNILHWNFTRNKERRFRLRKSMLGLRDISRRGWWERLWVVQEVALATGRVKIQCGHNSCDFSRFRSAQHNVMAECPEDKEMKQDFRASKRFGALTQHFRYSSFHDRQGELVKGFSRGMQKGMKFIFRGESDVEALFHEQGFAQRLQRILIRTAGQFQCRDDRDRLFAVLGIAGGAKAGEATTMANTIEWMSSFSTGMVIARAIGPLSEASSSPMFKLGCHALTTAFSLWAMFYDSRAKYWTISRPDYIVSGYEEVIDAVAGGSGAQRSRGQIFTALARYLANETGNLGFLDAAVRGEDDDNEMPSWVPNWAREVGDSAYSFATRVKNDQAPDAFQFIEDGKVLELVGWSKGKIDVVRSTETSPSISEKLLALPKELQQHIRAVLRSARELPEDGNREAMKIFSELLRISLDLGAKLLVKGGTTLAYSYAADELGFLKAGEAAPGDRLVVSPGCFHELVLRRQSQTPASGVRWKLVGLVAVGTRSEKRAGCSKSEWAQLAKKGALNKYTIV